ncbi:MULTISPECIES: tetratricopeptide repeat protein [Pseudomonas aeruginosa group]|uniref:tetratricopeptide repeat protein n=1 Tax=Pseudomonas aeruginosa group TaxID=136841 RepID=UPI000D1B85BD|nr:MULTISPECIES: tetratricopeptide repeat protein [Pseudomonas aeruginosa group]PTC34569.1 TPR repeat-containing protein [Pseudomonas aeruginosa]
MRHLLHRHEALDAEGFAAQLAGSPREAAQAILGAAREGLPEAQALLGQILLDGQGIERDAALARTWFGIAAEGGHAMARNMLARCLEHGWGGAADLAAAARHYRIAAGQGLDWARYNLANLYATGRGVEQDQACAYALYRQAAEQGHAKSMNLVGRYHEEGLVVARDQAQAAHWYRRSAEGGDFRGQFSHAAMLAANGRHAEAETWLRRALEGGNLNFLRSARHSLEQSSHPAFRGLALAYCRRAAELGDASDREVLERAIGHAETAPLPA